MHVGVNNALRVKAVEDAFDVSSTDGITINIQGLFERTSEHALNFQFLRMGSPFHLFDDVKMNGFKRLVSDEANG